MTSQTEYYVKQEPVETESMPTEFENIYITPDDVDNNQLELKVEAHTPSDSLTSFIVVENVTVKQEVICDNQEQNLIESVEPVTETPVDGCNSTRNAQEQTHNPESFEGPPKWACDLCDKRFHIYSTLKDHKKNVHLKYYKPTKISKGQPPKHHSTAQGTTNPKEKKTYFCPDCNFNCNSNYGLEQHINRHKQNKTFFCNLCSMGFYRKLSLKLHIQKVHENPNSIANRKGPFSCKICNKLFRISSRLEIHMRTHSQDQPFQCELCGIKLKTKKHYRLHKQKHKLEQNDPVTLMLEYKCRICGCSGFTGSQYRDHRSKLHSHIPKQGEREKSFACGVCGKPHSQRLLAVICAQAGHDPEQMKRKMFRYKCPECPPEAFGFCNTIYVRKHWEKEHPDKVVPVKFRANMFLKDVKHRLPEYEFDQKLCQQIRDRNGPLDDVVKNEFPLWVDLELLPIPEEQWFLCKPKEREDLQQKVKVKKIEAKKKEKVKKEEVIKLPIIPKCTICGAMLAENRNVRNHMMGVHKLSVEETDKLFPTKKLNRKNASNTENVKCHVCESTYASNSNLKRHLKQVHGLGTEKIIEIKEEIDSDYQIG